MKHKTLSDRRTKGIFAFKLIIWGCYQSNLYLQNAKDTNLRGEKETSQHPLTHQCAVYALNN